MTHRSSTRKAFLLLLLLIAGCSSPGGESSSAPESSEPAETQFEQNPALLVPELAHEQAPESFRVRFETTKGDFDVEVTRSWAPVGADRFYNLVRIGFFDDAAFFRAVDDFIVQFGVNGNPAINKAWSVETIPDDPRQKSNNRGYLSFAKGEADSRTTQLFINLKDNPELDDAGFVPIGRVIDGMDVVDSLYTGYGELYPTGNGPRFQLLNLQGNKYLKMHFPEMDYIKSARIIDGSSSGDGDGQNK